MGTSLGDLACLKTPNESIYVFNRKEPSQMRNPQMELISGISKFFNGIAMNAQARIEGMRCSTKRRNFRNPVASYALGSVPRSSNARLHGTTDISQSHSG